VHVIIINKGSTERDSESSPVHASVGRNLLRSFFAIYEKVNVSCVHSLNDVPQILRSLNNLQVSPSKASLLEHCCRQRRGPEKQCTPSFCFYCSRKNVAKNIEGLVGDPCWAETKL